MSAILESIRVFNRFCVALILGLTYITLFGVARLFVRKQQTGWHAPEESGRASSPY